MVTYEQIQEVNKDLSTMDIKGKDYVVVPQRVKAFRKIYTQGFIITDILSHENGVVVMQTKAGYYDENGNPVVLGTGLAQEKADSSYINKTSYIENCETSSVGRALGFLGFGIDAAICSAEELINAVNNQNGPKKSAGKPENGTVTPAQRLPETPGEFIKRRIEELKAQDPKFDFMQARKALIDGGVVEDIPSATMNMDQAVALMEAIAANRKAG